MSQSTPSLETLLTELKKQRDEVRLQMHLGSMEARDEYDRLSRKCDELADQFQPVTSAVTESSQQAFDAFRLLADELKIGFQRVAKAMIEGK